VLADEAEGGVKVHDVTAPLHEDVDPWPGDVAFVLEATASLRDGASCNVGAIRTSLHNGTHADAPLHVLDGAPSAADLPLEPFLGPAVVVERGRALDASGDELAEIVPRGHRVLLRSGRRDHRAFPAEVEGVPPAWIRALAGLDVPLLGVDLPSLDPIRSTSLPAHRACLEHGVQILENLVLADVAPGRYRLLALPLRVEGGDAAPVRAVLLEDA
jgi:arylformamidase